MEELRRPSDQPRRNGLLLHGGAVAILTAFLVITEWLTPDDLTAENIGGGAAFLGLFLIGLPWSLPAWFNFSWELRVTIAVAGAVANLIGHAVILLAAAALRRPL